MTPERWDEIDKLFNAVRDRPAHERAAFLDAASGSDPSIRSEVERMLLVDATGDSLLQDERWREMRSRLMPAGLPDPSPSPDWIGKKIGRYLITGTIGRGGMGEVYAAQDTELDRKVALKFVSTDSPGHRSAADRGIREAKAASALNHPNIVTVYEVLRAESGVAIAMELVDGTPLRELCGTHVATETVLHIGRQIAQALATAHAAGIVHRDVKPENVMVRPDSYVKVLDFGLARRFVAEAVDAVSGTGPTAVTSQSNQSSSLALGTFRYMSPEQYRGEPLTGASDVFALGIVLYELSTGKHPFAAENAFDCAVAIATGNPEAPSRLDSDVPRGLERLILAMLNKDPKSRPTADEVVRRLAEVAQFMKPVLRRGRTWLLSAGLLLIVVAAGRFLVRRSTSMEPAGLTGQPLTAQSGWEFHPALSPDGQSLAFTWHERLSRGPEIYLKRLDRDAVVKLTTSAPGLEIGSVVWSPDGSRIAFKRHIRKPAGAIYWMPKDGGEETKVIDLANGNPSSEIDWSPDGSQLVFSDGTPEQLSIYVYNMQSGEKRKLTAPPPGLWGDWDPKFSPDGQTIAFKRVGGFWLDDIYLVPTSGGVPRRLTADGRGIWGHSWMPDGKDLLVSSQRGGTVFGLWRFPVDPTGKPHRLTPIGVDTITPATSKKANRIAWVNFLEDYNIYRLPLARPGASTKLIASTMRDRLPDYSPDGRMAFVTDRMGIRQIWLARADGSEQVRVTDLSGPWTGTPRWSPDGRWLAFDSQFSGSPDVFLVRCEPPALRCGEPTRITTEPSSEMFPSWSADGTSLYFASDRTGRMEVWKQRVFGGQPQQVTRNGGFMAFESRDGKWVYFSRREDKGIWRIPGPKSEKSGYAEELIIVPQFELAPEGWIVAGDEVLYMDHPKDMGTATLRCYRIPTRETRMIFDFTDYGVQPTYTGVSVSPDSQWVAYSQLDRLGSNVMVADLN